MLLLRQQQQQGIDKRGRDKSKATSTTDQHTAGPTLTMLGNRDAAFSKKRMASTGLSARGRASACLILSKNPATPYPLLYAREV